MEAWFQRSLGLQILTSNKTRLHPPKTKSKWGSLSSPLERNETERNSASSTLTWSSTLTNALRGNQNNSESPPVADRQEKKILFPTKSILRKTILQFFLENHLHRYLRNFTISTHTESLVVWVQLSLGWFIIQPLYWYGWHSFAGYWEYGL